MGAGAPEPGMGVGVPEPVGVPLCEPPGTHSPAIGHPLPMCYRPSGGKYPKTRPRDLQVHEIGHPVSLGWLSLSPGRCWERKKSS